MDVEIDFFKSEVVISEVHRNTKTVNLRFLAFRCREFQTM